MYWAQQGGVNCSGLELLYFYHSDYLGSVEFVTDMRGEAYQFFLNTPWGENVENQFARNYTAFSSRFRFNGKEWDEETGNFYYGARYYDPKISVWLSVDPLASERSWLTPYNFCSNNPIMRVDPTGMLDWKPSVDDIGNATYTAENGDSPETLADQFGLTQKQAEQITGKTGSTSIAKGTQITGESVKNVTGSDILSLDLESNRATDQRKFDQYVFATNYSRANPDFSRAEENVYNIDPTLFYQNRLTGTTDFWSGNTGIISGIAQYKGARVEYRINVYTSVTQNRFFIGSSHNDINPFTGSDGIAYDSYRINSYALNGGSLGRKSWVKTRSSDSRILESLYRR